MSRPLLTFEQIVEWRRRLNEIEDEEARLKSERLEIERKLEAVAVLFGDVPSEGPEGTVSISEAAPVTQRSGKPTWRSEMVRVFDQWRTNFSFVGLREELDRGPLKGEFEKSEKGFYHAVSRLEKRGYLKRHKGWLFRAVDLEEHLRRVRAGEIPDVEDITNQRRSPMGEAAKEFVSKHPRGTSSGDVVSHLKRDKRFSESLNKNATGGYNVIARLVKRGEIKKEGGLLYPLNENEAPAGASEADAGSAPHAPPASISQPSHSGA